MSTILPFGQINQAFNPAGAGGVSVTAAEALPIYQQAMQQGLTNADLASMVPGGMSADEVGQFIANQGWAALPTVGPNTGLAGATNALGQGQAGALKAIQESNAAMQEQLKKAMAGIQSSQNYGRQMQGQSLAAQKLAGQQAMQRLQASQDFSRQYGDKAISALQDAEGRAVNAINTGFGDALQGFGEFRDPGVPALNMNAALSGALGPAAQAQAFADFQDDPGTQWLRDRGRQERLAAASATGGLGGGNVLKAIESFGQGLAAQQLGQRQDRLAQITGTGLQAQGMMGGLRGEQASTLGNLIGNFGRAQSDAYTQTAGRNVDLSGMEADAILGSRRDAANIINQATRNDMDAAGMSADVLGALASGIMGAGRDTASIFGRTGSELAALREGAGRDLARSIEGTTTALADLLAKEGISGAGEFGGTDEQIAETLRQLGVTDADSLSMLMQLLANTRKTTAEGVSAVPSVQSGNLQELANVFAGIGAGYSGFTGG